MVGINLSRYITDGALKLSGTWREDSAKTRIWEGGKIE
jgi:hypothetical protein